MRVIAIFFILSLALVQLRAQQPLNPNKRLGYYAACYPEILNSKSKKRISEAIEELKIIRDSLCRHGCPHPVIHFLIGIFKCAIDDRSGYDDLALCLNGRYKMDPGDRQSLKSSQADCGQTSRPKSKRIKLWVLPAGRAGSGGTITKLNQESSPRYIEEIPRLFDTSQAPVTAADFFARVFDAKEIPLAISYYDSLISKGTLKGKMRHISQDQYLVYYGNRVNVRPYLKTIINTTNYCVNSLHLDDKANTITSFLIPATKLTREKKQKYGWKFSPGIQFPTFSGQNDVRQQLPQKFKIWFGHMTDVPLYERKLDFLLFAYQKDGVILSDGVVGYSNPYDNSIISFAQNYTGSFNHELVHQIVDNNYTGLPTWLNEGLACLFEAVRYKNGGQLMIPQNNFRIRTFTEDSWLDSNAVRLILTKSWEDIDSIQNRYRQLSLARYVCFYLHEKGVLSRFLDTAVARYKTGGWLNEEQATDLMFNTTGHSSFKAFSDDLQLFIDRQKKIAFRNGKLKKRFQVGVYNDSFIW